METILLVILIVIAVAMIGIVLLQRSEGGALGIGGGPSAMFSARGTANLLTRATAVLGALFMILSLVLAILSGGWGERDSVLDAAGEAEPAPFAADPLELPGESDFADDLERLDLPEDERSVVPRAD